MRFFVSLLAIVLFAAAAQSQMLMKNPEPTGAVTPGDMTKRLEATAERIRKISPSGAPRVAQLDFAWPQDEDEYRKFAKHVIVLVSVVTQDERELPLKRVYIRNKWNREFPLERIASERREVAKDSPIRAVLGGYREDSFYLAPAGLMKGEGEVVADFALNRTGFRLYSLPGTPPDFIEADRRPMPAPGARPEPKALKAMLEREYAGFRLPEGLP
jgi:hypothetical protein